MATGQLPGRSSSFVGRETELTQLGELVGRHRLVTVTGPGGGGKSRLALMLAERLRSAYAGRVRWVELAELTDPTTVLTAVADALELPGATEEELTSRSAQQPTLLVIDNCEHLLVPVAQLIGRLLRACPELTVLATSQEPLGSAGEVVFAVPPMGAAAEALFVERARAASYGFEQSNANTGDIALICQRLDGIPLAIELAAAWVPVLSPAQIADRLNDSLRVLTGGDRDAMPRHRTLRDALDWSWNLMEHPERDLLAQLAVFQSGFTVDAVEAVAVLDGTDVLHSLSRLVNRSLVMVQQGPEVRYRLLETVRQYAADKLAGDTRPARRHAQYMLKLVEQAASRLESAEQQDWLDLLSIEWQSIREARRWFLQRDDVESVTRVAVGVWWGSYLLGRFGEVREWLEEALRRPCAVPVDLRADALIAAGTLAHLQGDASHAESRLRAGFSAYRDAGDPSVAAMELHWLGGVAMRRGEYAEARRLGERCLELWREIGNRAKVSRALDYQGMRELLAGELDLAEVLLREARARYESDRDSEGLGWVTVLLGGIAHYRGEQAVARVMLQEARERSQTNQQLTTLAWSLQLLGQEARRDGDLDEAAGLLAESLRLHRDAGNRWRMATVLEGLAAVAIAQPDVPQAVRLISHAALIREQLGTPVPAVERADVTAVIEAARVALPSAQYRTYWAEGEVFDLDRLLGEESTARPAAAPLTIAESRVEPLQVVALGSSEVRRNDTVLDVADWGYAKPRELFFYLLGSGPVSKDQIGAELWPDASATSLRNSFHSCLHQLRKTLGRSDWVTFRRGRYEFNHSLDHTYDVAIFESTLDRQEAVELYRGEYLADLSGPLWIETRRQNLRRYFERALLQLAESHRAAGRTAEAIALYERAVSHDPLLESAHQALIRLHLSQGDRAQAVRQYNDLVARLADDLNTTPSVQTTALIHPVLRSKGAASQRTNAI
ncbi:BTAD domain-containing putative transcriptional regulator [Kribbella sp. NPDC023855]|uniref:BTAD domain-containing putative transcriptional regulator n=1 Tax=Kribbella sp. NPDC023855 TaxID=3154698 RepID=UPI00340B7692